MMKQGQARVMLMAPVLLASALVSACAISTPATITSAQSNVGSITSIQLLQDDADAGGLRSRFHKELAEHFQERGIAVASDADYVADFSVSQRDAEVGLQPVSDGNEAAQPITPSIRSRWYHQCKPTRISASLVVYARADGALKAKSSGEFMACPDDTAQLGDLAHKLIERSLDN